MTALTDLDLEPGIQHWVRRIGELAATLPDIASPDPTVQRVAARELSDLIAIECTLPIPDGIELEDFEIEGPGGTLVLRRYRPTGASGPLPTQVWLHGGGFYAGAMVEILNDRLCARRTLESGVQLCSLEYRLAPEHRYPAPIEDAIAALRALADEPERFGVDASRLGIGGNSAGAAIAASTALHLRDVAHPTLHHVDLEVPPTAMRKVGASSVDFSQGFGLDEMETIVDLYLGPDGATDAYASPLDVEDLTGLPPTLIMAAEFDPLRDAGVEYAERLREAGVPVELLVVPGHLHGSPGQTAASPAAFAWQQEHSRRLAAAYR
ncbi:alpha/beta hydrolase [Agrococcus jejuensis]|uniref:Acetyl esterase n=1 Tax=Agrococcus jejuensis TaxID=399736 RepID=A0A1G8G1L5_9MICO|nr:alpha/beta hydrolase [Agrococcus jejuensis]SDH88116.1 acetyl esterase [Agrococcus jejuensis]